MKTCTKCKKELSVDLFRKDKTKKDGLSPSCKECKSKVDLVYTNKNKEKIKKYTELNKERKVEYDRLYRLENSEKRRESLNNYYLKNKDKLLQKRNESRQKRINEDPLYRFNLSIRSLISKSFKRGKNKFIKNMSSEEILNCSIDHFREYISSMFKDGMSFDNYGKWHLDHIKPVSTAKDEEEMIELNHYKNFQPLWAKENLMKNSKY
jgi:hypothetical protein